MLVLNCRVAQFDLKLGPLSSASQLVWLREAADAQLSLGVSNIFLIHL